MILMMVLFWGSFLALAVWLIRGLRTRPGRSGAGSGEPTGADEVLATRFARGEIGEAEFTRRRELLRSARP